MANTLKFVCECKTVVMEVCADKPLTIAVHGKVGVSCTVCGKQFEYMNGTGGRVAIADNGGISVNQ